MEVGDTPAGDSDSGGLVGPADPWPDPVGVSGGPSMIQQPCTDCTEKARELGIVPRALRISWTVDTLHGVRPVTDSAPDKVAVNVDHTLYLAQRRAQAREEIWDELGLDRKIALVRSLADFWPKEGVNP